VDRQATIQRKTKETEIQLHLNLDARGSSSEIQSSIPFFDHMLTHIAHHGNIKLELKGVGDVEIDDHHLVEDTGIVFGQAMKQALGNLQGIARYGHFTLPMDETLVTVAVDFSGRTLLRYQVPPLPPTVGNFDTELIQEFFLALVRHVPMTVHIFVHYGENTHHILEGIFKCFGRALAMAIAIDPRRQGEIPSTKGSL